MAISDALRQLVTESDNQTHDVFRWLALLSVFAAIGFAGWEVVKLGKDFDVQSYGIGLGALLGAVCAALGLKPETKPSAQEPQ